MFVGTPETVATVIQEYYDAGVRHLIILHSWPQLEEAEIFGREVLPLLKNTGLALLPNLVGKSA